MNMQQGVQTDTTCDIQQCWELLANNASVCTGYMGKECSDFLVIIKSYPNWTNRAAFDVYIVLILFHFKVAVTFLYPGVTAI